MVRTCVLEDIASGGTQCGTFRFQGDPSNDSIVDVMSGCVLTCDYDGCNTGSENAKLNVFSILFLLLFLFFYRKIVQ